MLENHFRPTFLFSLLLLCAPPVDAQQTPGTASSPNASPSPTPPIFSPQTLGELKQLQQAALTSDYAYRQVAHLSNNIGPRLTGYAQAAKAVEYVASELKTIGCEAYGEAVIYRADGPSAAARQGAVACLIRSVGGADYRLPHTGQTDYANDAPKIPAGAVTAEDADLIADLIRQGPVRMKLVLTPQTLPDVESANVIGDIKGSEHPEQVIVVSGHLDSWDLGTGAIDDGAGVAVSMEVANVIQKLHLKPKRTIRVIAWMNEENGLAGSKQYAKDHEKEWMNHFAAMETDGGADHPLGINIKAKPEVKKTFAPVAAILQASGAGMLNLVEHCGADKIGRA